MTTPEQNISMALSYIEALSKGDYDTIGSLLSDEISHDFSRNGVEVDFSSRANVIDAGQAAGLVAVNVHDVLASGDRVAARYSYIVSSDDVENALPDTTVEVSAIMIVRIENGRIREIWNESDNLGLLLQLGMLLVPAA